MPQTILSARLQMLIEIALHADCDCPETQAEQDVRARAAGLVGVEIDAARTRSSFDVQALAAIRLACAMKQGTMSAIGDAEVQAHAVGLSPSDIVEIKGFIGNIL